MKKVFLTLICVLMITLLCACNSTDTPDAPVADTDNVAVNDDGTAIVGTWVCDDIDDDVYFIFDENGDAYAKWGTSTVYGYYDWYEDDGVYDIDVPNLLYNEYEAHITNDTMTLVSEESSFRFEKAQMPEIIIKTPDNIVIDEGILGDWQSEQSYECYRFNSDGTAVVTDLYNYSTVDCKFSCNDGVVTLYYMSSETQDGSQDMEYSLDGDKLTINGYTYEAVSAQ